VEKMSDVNSLFKKKKGKSKKLDLSAATAPKKPSKTKADKKKEAAEDDEWKTETKKAVVVTSGKAVEEFGKKYTEEVVYDEDLDMSTKIDMDDTRKMLQDVIQRSTAVDTTPEEKKEEDKPPPEVNLKSLSIEERFARASSTSKYVARGGGMSAPKKSLEEEYPTLGVSAAKSAPPPAMKKTPKPPKLREETSSETPETIFRATEEVKNPPVPIPANQPEPNTEVMKETVVATENAPKVEEVSESVQQQEVKVEDVVVAKKEVKKKKKKGGAFEI
jgi:hypothetical protein